MSYSFGYSFVITLVIVLLGTRCVLCDVSDEVDQQMLVDDIIIPELYLGYRRALDNSDEGTVSFRRVIRNNKEYNIHVQKLKDVNGWKRHNLIVKEKSSDHPLIYVSNPVETRIPNAYLSLEGFKELLTGRVLRQRVEFMKENHPKEFTTLEYAKYLTTKRNNVITRSRKKPSKKHTPNIKLKKRKSTSKVKKITANVPDNHKKHTYLAIISSPKLKLTSGILSKATIVPTEHHILRTNANTPPETAKDVEMFTERVTKGSIATESITNTVVVSKTDEFEYSRELREKEDINEIKLLTTVSINVRTTKDSSIKESINNESTPKESTVAESTTEQFTTAELTGVESSSLKYTIEESSDKTTTTTEVTSTETSTTKELTTQEPFTEEITTKETINTESTTELTNTEESTIKKPAKPRRKKLTTIAKMPKTKRTTLGRPLVFMGGY